jgi:SWIM zinc finger
VAVTISADDPRSIRAIEIAAGADRWRRWHTTTGEEAFGVPSQTQPGRSYEVTQSRCDCPDFLRSSVDASPDQRACKHILAVRLYCELVRAQQHGFQLANTPARRHLRLVR